MADVTEMVCFSLYSASRATTRAYATLLAPWNLSYPQYLALVVLWIDGEQTVNGMGVALELDSGTLSPLLRRMEEKGLIVRTRSANDARSVIITPTPRAQALRDDLAHVPVAIAQAMGLADIAQARELTSALHRLTSGMDALSASSSPSA